MTNPITPAPALLTWASRALGARPVVQDASNPHENSRVWQLSVPGDVRFYLKVSPRPLMYERETVALRHSALALGVGHAPQLRASSTDHLTLLLTAAPGRPLKQLTLTPAEETSAHRQGGALLARLYAAGDLSGPRRTEAEQALQAASDGADHHLQQAGDRLTAAEQKLVRDLAEQLRTLPPPPLAFIHGDAWERNLMWSTGLGQAGWIDFERSRLATAVQDFVLMACTPWADRPDLRAACLQGYGRDLTPEEQNALACLAALDAVSCLAWGPAHDDPHVTARGRRTLDRLMAGVFA
ncbi:aminoglycoside phosphotransferase family protein [Streptomyces sp. S.PNR 29]|uniref:aminoglycoside phosphotransferase family protein n=1 Tax=Streptomyces sp. S.PNR 29 TaxID=2973805 RepID=UPI0025B19034|nr:aminoglycoside phosphotransferase family protein [Streptomyces sp. S.PNR 29]MDN0200000.1 aminoglycoside phosphotransferase family protein [Streptomyces sp. S.PNR 29]